MWILHFLPDALVLWICNTVLLAGILLTAAAFFIRRIPVINQYRTPAQVLGIALLVTGVYWRGGYAIEQEWRERVAEVEAKLAETQKQSAAANAALAKKSQAKVRVIQGRTQIVRQYIDREVVRYDTRFAPGGVCEIPREFVKAHNSAAETPK